MKFFAPLALISTLYFGAAPAHALDDHINRLLVERRLPGMVLVIAREGKVVHEKAYGFAAGISYRHSGLLETSLDKFSAALAAQALEHLPGKGWTYGPSSDVLGAVIEKLSGSTLPDYFERNIFAPLGMTRTSFAADPAKLVTMYRMDRSTGLPDPSRKLAVAAMMQLEGARAELENRLQQWIDEWLRTSVPVD